jgi:hypothetical protein
LISFGMYILKLPEPSWLYFSSIMKYLFFGCAFCALCTFFHNNLKIFSLVVGVVFLLKWIFYIIIGTNGYIIPIEIFNNLIYVIDILNYLFLALFFFGFNKTYKS